MMSAILAMVAIAISLAALTVNFLTYRSAGPKVSLLDHRFEIFPTEVWLKVRVTNAGRGEIDLDGATCDALGPTYTLLTHRMRSSSTHLLEFKAPLSRDFGWAGSVTVNIGLGTGRTLTSQLRLNDNEQAQVRSYQRAIEAGSLPAAKQTVWRAPQQEEL